MGRLTKHEKAAKAALHKARDAIDKAIKAAKKADKAARKKAAALKKDLDKRVAKTRAGDMPVTGKKADTGKKVGTGKKDVTTSTSSPKAVEAKQKKKSTATKADESDKGLVEKPVSGTSVTTPAPQTPAPVPVATKPDAASPTAKSATAKQTASRPGAARTSQRNAAEPTLVELRQQARTAGLSGYSKLSKADLSALLARK